MLNEGGKFYLWWRVDPFLCLSGRGEILFLLELLHMTIKLTDTYLQELMEVIVSDIALTWRYFCMIYRIFQASGLRGYFSHEDEDAKGARTADWY